MKYFTDLWEDLQTLFWVVYFIAFVIAIFLTIGMLLVKIILFAWS